MMIHTMVTFFDISGVEHIPKEIIEFIGNKTITLNFCRVQSNDSMCGYFRIEFIDFILKGKFYIKRKTFVRLYNYFKLNYFKLISLKR